MRLKEETLLLKWMRQKRRTASDVAEGVDASPRAVKYWMWGQQLPCLISAYKVEAYTQGKVPPESWLGTTLGKAKWNNHKDPEEVSPEQEDQEESDSEQYDG